ncbi:unnamed protein product [Chilo suppressalis]|uniref:Rad4 beta-hairpin domain-containing protein n=1 Tax=Chilo suppressalis TaxID=168631 RepID=A0ABN8AXD7_CHISP|nr:hypothetical protein evm_009390 [Chilo suppressalis]CAH0397462.1 unnamed protein product [Chilo suppressalis]
MPNTRKKVIKTVYKDADDSDAEEAFSDSGSEAKITEESSSEDEGEDQEASSGDEFKNNKKSKYNKTVRKPKPKFAKSLINKINKQSSASAEIEYSEFTPSNFSVKDLTEEDKILPPILNLSESDSSDDEEKVVAPKQTVNNSTLTQSQNSDSDSDNKIEYKDVWSKNLKDSEEIARKAFLELEHHNSLIEKTKESLEKYTHKKSKKGCEFDVSDLLAQGEQLVPQKTTPVKKRITKVKDDSDSEMEDWEEVKESNAIPQQGLQLIVELPNTICRKTKKVDVEMMMKRKMNRVKKEYQVYMHKVHVLCWLGHGNYVSKVLNDQELLAASLSLVPSKECYPGERVDMKYLEQITTWYKDKFTLKQDKNENKFRPKAPALKDLLIGQIKSRTVTTRKYLVYIFVCMLRALGLQCRVMFNFVTLPLRPPSSELCSLSTKPKDDKCNSDKKTNQSKKTSHQKKTDSRKAQSKDKISQVDGADDAADYYNDDSDIFENIAQLDGSDDLLPMKTRSTRSRKAKDTSSITPMPEDDVSPPKRSRKSPSQKPTKNATRNSKNNQNLQVKNTKKDDEVKASTSDAQVTRVKKSPAKTVLRDVTKTDKTAYLVSPRKTRNASNRILEPNKTDKTLIDKSAKKDILNPPAIVITSENDQLSSKYFEKKEENSKLRPSRKRSNTTTSNNSQLAVDKKETASKPVKTRTKSAPETIAEKSKYFETTPSQSKKPKLSLSKPKPLKVNEDKKRVSHRDLVKPKPDKIDVKDDIVTLIKARIKEAKEESKKGIVKGKVKEESEDDSDYLPEEVVKRRKSAESDDDFKPMKMTPKPSTSKKIDRRVLSSSEEDLPKNKVDVWCEVFVEELEQWISVDVVKSKVHCAENIYSGATHPVCYVVGWDNNNYLKDLTRRYVPHWNTVTRKQRAEPQWWSEAVQPWLGPKNARNKEEDEQLDRMQLEAPLPKSIAEYKNHPLYALKRHLLKYEALYPPDAAVLGFVRSEPVYARECVYICRSRDTWLKEAKVVRLGETPYKIVKARPKWDKLSNKLITDKPLEIFGPWQVQDYEPPVAENGIVPRNAYGNVELFKDCMLPKGTVHIKLPGLNKVAKKLNIDCAPAMTGFDFNGGWSHPVYDGFVVCAEYEKIITEAWVQDQEEQERKEREKIDARVYGNWRRLIKGLLIRERLKHKYGFEEPKKSNEIRNDKKNPKGPRLVVKKK